MNARGVPTDIVVVAADVIIVDANLQRLLRQVLERNDELEYGVKLRVQRSLLDRRLLAVRLRR